MAIPIKKIPIEGVDFDTDETRLPPNKAKYIKNLTFTINKSPTGEGNNFGILTPLEGSQLFSISFPAGNNYCVGFKESPETGEAYAFVHNSNNNHFIYRINANGTLQIVYQNADLKFQLNPRYFISTGRCEIRVAEYINKVSGLPYKRVFILFTDFYNTQRFISANDSIATNYFTGTYFNSNSNNYQHEYLISLGVPTPVGCVQVTPKVRPESEKNKQNLINNKGWEFRIKYIDIFGRESEHGPFSDKKFTLIGGNCIANSSGLARCWLLKFDAGYPLVNKIQVEFRICSGTKRNLTVDGPWQLYDTINKYNDCEKVDWWNRTIANPYQARYDQLILEGKTPDEAAALASNYLKYNSGDNTFEYTFCGDRECQPIPVPETDRLFNPIPLVSSSLFSIDRGIGLANNKRGYEPLDCAELEKLDFVVNPPAEAPCENTKLREIVVYAKIWNPYLDQGSLTRRKDGVNVFGLSDCVKNNPIAYDQRFIGNQEGWIGYLTGTEHAVVSEQVRHTPGAHPSTDTFIGLDNIPEDYDFVAFQKWTFKVSPGIYVFRIANQMATFQSDYMKSSTYVVGHATMSSAGRSLVNKNNYEMVINVCNGDYLSDSMGADMLMIWDLTRDARDTKINLNDCWADASTVVDGYIFEDQVSRIPVERASVFIMGSGERYGNDYTDHNGFYFGTKRRKNTQVQISWEDCDSFHVKFSREAIDNFNNGGHLRHDEHFGYTGSDEYPEAGRHVVKGRIALCDNDSIGIAGVLVVMKNCQWTVTDANGDYTLIQHGRYGDFANEAAEIIISQKGSCQISKCDDPCDFCFAQLSTPYKGCVTPRVSILNVVTASIRGVNQAGPKNGGRYGLAVWGWDWMGRPCFAQSLDKHYVDIPSILDTKVFQFSTIGFVMDNSIRFPSWVKHISFGITENLNWDDDMMWAADKIEFVDASGNVNNAAPTQIKIYYDSLAEFNKINNLSTTVNWDFIVKNDASDSMRVGDIVEFICFSNGTFLDKSIQSLVKYDKDGRYIMIDYIEDLKDLDAGSLIKLIRPKTCLNKHIFNELCPMIKILDNGAPAVLSGTFNFYDSYMLSRVIPVPTHTTSTSPQGQVTVATTYQVKKFPFFFEHHSPSDFWGDHCVSKGRVNVKDPNERQKVLGMEIALSKAFLNKSNFNGLSYFSNEDVHPFDEQEWGSIVIVIVSINTLLVICENDHFVVGYKDNQIVVDDEGRAYSSSTSQSFGKPHRKIGKDFGCQMIDINSIRYRDGIVAFVDRAKKAVVMHNFEDCADVSETGFKSWMTEKVRFMQSFTGNNAIPYFHAGIDPKTNEYYLTNFVLTLPGSDVQRQYTDTGRGIAINQNETIVLDMSTGILKNNVLFTPEYYGSHEIFRHNFISFKEGGSWLHHGTTAPINNFFGVQGEKVLDIIFNASPEKTKRFLYNEVYCKEHLFIIDKITTSDDQESRLLATWWDVRDKFSMADFKCATNGPLGNILEGPMLTGRWLRARYISQSADNAKYSELGAIVGYVIDTGKSAD